MKVRFIKRADVKAKKKTSSAIGSWTLKWPFGPKKLTLSPI